MRRTLRLLGAACLALALACGPALAYPTDLDPAFGGDGRVTTDFSPADDPHDDQVVEVLAMPDGDVVAVGTAAERDPDAPRNRTNLALARYNPDGSPDASFGQGGQARARLFDESYVSAAALAPEGKIVVVGEASTRTAEGQYQGGYYVARFLSDGSPDPSFSDDGKILMQNTQADDVAVGPDGKIVLAGYGQITRLNPDGSPDASFSEDGVVPASSNARYVGLQPDGGIVVGGIDWMNEPVFEMQRFLPDGSPDASFGVGGTASITTGSYEDDFDAFEVQPDGKVVVGGMVRYHPALFRLNADGSSDASFGRGGRAVADGLFDDYVTDVAFQPDGKPVAVTRYFSALRFTIGGRPDATFAKDGAKEYLWDSGVPRRGVFGVALAVLPGGKVVAAGAATKDGSLDFALARALGGEDGEPPETEVVDGPDSATASQVAYLRSVSSEPGSTFECSIDSALFAPCEGEVSLRGLADGAHALRVRATDALGNTDATPAERTWTVDTVAPGGAVAVNGGKRTTGTLRVTLSLTASDAEPGSGISELRIKNAGDAWTAWTPLANSLPWRLSRGSGTKTVYVQYRDRAGNVSVAAYDKIIYRP